MSDPNQQWTPPPPPPGVPPTPPPEGPEMSTPATLSGIFFEPGRTFEALRRRPRFLVVGLILLFLTIGVTGLVNQRIDMAQFIRDKMEQNPRNANQTEEQKELGVKIGKIIGAVGIPLSVPITLAAGVDISGPSGGGVGGTPGGGG